MMNKRTLVFKSALLCCMSTALLCSSASVFALTALQQQQAAYKQQFLQSSLQSTQQRQAQQSAENARVTLQANQQVQKTLGIQNQTNQPANASNAGQAAQVATCDCYNMQDSNNVSNQNFYFDHTGLRAHRISPACKCLPPTDKELAATQRQSVKTAPVSTVVNTPIPAAHPTLTPATNPPVMGSPSNNGNKGSGQFDIKYN